MSKRLRIGVDFDDVVADLLPAWLARYNLEHGTNWTAADLTQWDVWKDLGCEPADIYKHLTPSIYDDVKPVPDAIEAIRDIERLGHIVVIVTSVQGDEPAARATARAKCEWLSRHGLPVQRLSMIPVGSAWNCKSKADADVDWLIDDNVPNVEGFPGHGLVVTRPHNRAIITVKKRVRGLQDVVPMLRYDTQPEPSPAERAGRAGSNPMYYQAEEQMHDYTTKIAERLQRPAQPILANIPGPTLPVMPANATLSLSVTNEPTKSGKGYDPQISNPKDIIGSSKLPLHLWPETATALGCLGFLDGALKYGRSNFREIGVRASIYVDAVKRHVNKWFEGEDTDPESGLPHLAHALACLAILVDAQAAGKLRDDRQVRGGYLQLVRELTPHVARLKEMHAERAPKHYTIADNPDAAA